MKKNNKKSKYIHYNYLLLPLMPNFLRGNVTKKISKNSKYPTILLALLAALLVAPLFMTWVVVDVQTYDEDAVNLKLPIPLALARIDGQ